MVTSGTFAPRFDRPIAMAYLAARRIERSAGRGRVVEVEIRGRKMPATVVPLPFYRRDRTA